MKSIQLTYSGWAGKMLAVSMILSGCRKFVQLDPPITKLVTSTVFSTDAAAISAQDAIYVGMYINDDSYFMSANCGLLSDELDYYATNATQVQYHTNSMLANNAYGTWNNGFKYIYEANAIIENLRNNVQLDPGVVTQLTGEAKFIRAFWFFYLTNEYGDIPLPITTNYAVNESLSRTPRAQVYQQIIADLSDAQGLLNANYVDNSDTAVTTERARPNRAAAQSLLARAYLYSQKYDSAEAWASAVIGNSQYSLCSNLSGPNSVFLKNSTEAIWQLQPALSVSADTWDGYFYVLRTKPGGSTPYAITQWLYNSFEAGDNRATNWVGVYASGGKNYYYPFKYKVYNNAAASLSQITEYTMVLRLAEQYLIRAEARAQKGDTTGALSDLNAIRSRVGLANYAGATDQASLLIAILHERRVELFTEWGNRWFDLNRTGSTDTVLGSPGNVYNLKGGIGTWNSDWELIPIQTSEIISDPHLIQNPGY